MEKKYRRVLTIAGSDSGAGAGIQADLKTFAANGCYGMSVITALTAQNTQGVSGIFPIAPAFVAAQIEAVLSDMGADAVKIGMLYSAELIETVANQLKKYAVDKVVLDPVMVAQSGDKLLQDDAIEALCRHLMPLATLITPNLPEAEVLLGCSIKGIEPMKAAAKQLARYGSGAVYLKGGHLQANENIDVLYLPAEKRLKTLAGQRIATRNNHGTGCTLSSAMAAFLAQGDAVEEAARRAKDYIQQAIEFGAEFSIGKGHGPVHHFYKFWD